jgi:hypothetical protein
MLPIDLTADGLFKACTFLMHAPRFKDDIRLISPDTTWPADVPPPILPLSVASLLSRICDLEYKTIEQLWDVLKDVVWNWAGRVQEINERYRQYSNELGYCVSLALQSTCYSDNEQEKPLLDVIYPPSQFCTNENCKQMRLKQKLQKVEQRKGILYTLDKGACPIWIMKLYCHGRPTILHSRFHQYHYYRV